MAQIYHRSTLVSNTKAKEKKEKRRKRNVILNFRVSEEEKKLINERITLSGLKKQDFFIQSCMYQKIVTYGNIKTFTEINKRLAYIEKTINSLQSVNELDIELLESLRMILEIFDGLQMK